MRGKVGFKPMAACRLPGLMLGVCLGFAVAVLGAMPGAVAQKAEPGTKFLGFPIVPDHGRYVVATDVNVRAEPKTASAKLASLSRGERVLLAGRFKGDEDWLAVLKNGEPLGFVYGDMMLPLIDGALSEPISAEVSAPNGGTCTYVIRFEGKSPVEDNLFEVADYTVRFKCTGDELALSFSAPMFLTEAPYQMGAKPEYQITLDIVDISEDRDQVFSSTSIYNGVKETLRFDGVSVLDFGGAPSKKEHPVGDVAEALRTAVDLAVRSWNAKLWDALAKAKK